MSGYIEKIKERARADVKTIVMPETNDKRIIIAAAHIIEEGIANIILVGNKEKIMDGAGWLEILGCGMVDPNVLELCGIDSKVYTGYAFGVGVERITNLKYMVKDLRMFSENDVRFLREFEHTH